MRRQQGLSLMEALIALAVSGLLIALLMGVYVQGTGGYSRVQAQNLTERTVELAFRAIENACWDAMYAEVDNGRLILTYPRDTDAYGNPIPVKTGESPVYRAGQRYAYYLSDATGNPNRPGTILWRGTVSGSGTITPDREWSLESSGRGRIMPLVEFTPSVQVNPTGVTVTVQVRAQLRSGGEVYETRRQRSFLVRNANAWR
ncbi:MAG: type II secretion system GspH family protein [Fimbriimonadales bacterium]|jgi:type II secretory pathway pseudopilin PulG|nr:type II secretion system GspH family protein [Armatimonadota bacterium]MCX7687233.1 type II secretion system GspH family protein [Fimbriimonadales bacterium]CUU02983.1 hypothetical protein GBSOP10_102415 [Armatimonadetes bacterium GBS]CUU34918.1 hypothetical protein DCOP10_11240 [Armatimonadetes bacterium DC]CUU37164.1 hypothetical protein GXSOP10_13035 [Armatimonadetes bacterium GXS]GBC89320.1 hypothetical protein HRbin14_00041 [bacterium HR14]